MSNQQDNNLNVDTHKKVTKLIVKVIEPQIGKVVEEFNKAIEKYGVAAACTINWEFIPLNEKESRNGKTEKSD